LSRESGIVFLPAETLFRSCRDDRAVHHQSGGGIVIQRGNSQDLHGSRLEQRVDERSDHRGLREDEKRSQQQHHHENRKQPELLAIAHIGPQFTKNGHGFSPEERFLRTALTYWLARAPADRAGSSS